MAALADNDDELSTAQYRLLELWQQSYQGELLILLPDTFGTTQFLRRRARLGGELDRPAHRQQRCLSLQAMNILHGLSAMAATRATSASSPPMRSTWSRFSAFTPISAELCSMAPRPRFSIGQRLSRCNTVDPRAPHSLQRRLGNSSDQRFSQLQSTRRRRFQPRQPGLQTELKSTAGPPSSSLTTTPRPLATPARSSATAAFSALPASPTLPCST